MSIYGNLLKNLIGFSGVKLTSVSEAIGYDDPTSVDGATKKHCLRFVLQARLTAYWQIFFLVKFLNMEIWKIFRISSQFRFQQKI